jgi:hypothetical protein
MALRTISASLSALKPVVAVMVGDWSSLHRAVPMPKQQRFFWGGGGHGPAGRGTRTKTKDVRQAPATAADGHTNTACRSILARGVIALQGRHAFPARSSLLGGLQHARGASGPSVRPHRTLHVTLSYQSRNQAGLGRVGTRASGLHFLQ